MLKAKALEFLLSQQGILHRKRRMVDVEPVFGMIKKNKGFRRFYLKGIENVNIELGLLFMVHNLSKITSFLSFLLSFERFKVNFQKLWHKIAFILNFYLRNIDNFVIHY